MKKIIHYYTCVLCNKSREVSGDLGTLSGSSSGWTKIDLGVKPNGGHLGLSMLVCGECMETDSSQKASLLSSKPLVPKGYVDHKIIQVIHCDGQDCTQKEEKTIGPPNRIPIGVHPFPWAVVTGGLLYRGEERHYCPKCMHNLQPHQKPIARGGPFEGESSYRRSGPPEEDPPRYGSLQTQSQTKEAYGNAG